MEIRKRLATAALLLAVVVAVIQYAPAWVLFAVLQALIVLGLLEFYALAYKKGFFPQKILGVMMALTLGVSFVIPRFSFLLALTCCFLAAAAWFVPRTDTIRRMMGFPQSAALTFFGALYLGATLNHFLLIRQDYGFLAVYFLLVVVLLGDTGAFLIGSLIGRHKMLPIASPRKTWEGALGGLIWAGAAAIPAQVYLLPELPLGLAVAAGILTSAAAQIADPFESLFKRAAGVKDSGNLFPGHGGVLDRVDSLTLAGPFFFYFLRLFLK